MKAFVRTHLAAAALLLVPTAAFVATPAVAQSRAVVATPSIESLALRSSGGLDAGDTLRVTMQATPGARDAHVTLGDSGVRIALQERAAGRYVGTHTIKRGERIDPHDRMAIRARYGSQTIAATVGYPAEFQAMASGRAPQIERFVLNARGGIVPGRELRFRLVGEAGGRAWVRVPGVVERLELQESRPGVYVGDYTVRRRDNAAAFERAVATLQEDRRRSTAAVTVRNDDDDDRGDRVGRGGRDLQLDVTSHADNAVVDADGQITIRGRTAPNASVYVQVQARNPFTGLFGLTPPPADQWVRADANGRFVARMPAQGLPVPGTRYDVSLRATDGTQTAEESLTLYQRQS